jgi:type I restriction enzyme S subunit
MPNNWKKYKLEELTSVITKGTTPSTYGFDFEEKGINYIRAQSLNYDGRIDNSVFSFISEKAHQKLKRSQLEAGDILFSMAGAYLGMTGMVKESHCPANTNQAVGIIRIKNKEVIPKFVEYALRNPSTVSYVNSQSGQSAQPNINLAEIGNLTFLFPPLPEQHAIASILSALDDKIELNLQMNKTLEDMAMALYKHYFVDFGPFQNGEFIDSELGEIPKGWEVKSIGELYNTTSGGTPSRKKNEYYDDGTIPWVKSKELYGNFVISTEERITQLGLKKSSAKLIPPKAVLLAMYGATVGESSILSIESTCNQAICAIIEKDISYLYIYHYLRYHKQEILNQAVGSAQQNISQVIIKKLRIISPPKGLKIFFEIENYFNLIEQNLIQNQTLTQLRDTLLPKLISGEVRVKDIEKTVAAVL